MKNNHSKNNYPVFKLSAITGACLLSFGAHASSLEADGIKFNLENKLSVSAATRVQSKDLDLIGIANGGKAYSTNHDDGDLAFKTGDLVSSEAKLTSDLTISKGNFGIFARGSAFAGNFLDHQDLFNKANYGPGKAAPLSEYDAKNDAVSDHNDFGVDWLDTYLYGSFPVLNHSVSFKLGRHSINWGESTYVLNGINSLLAFDANRSHSPDFALNEVVIPAAMLSVAVNLTDKVSLETFYQLKWERTQPEAAGTYFSTSDFTSIGGTRANIGFGKFPENTPGTTIVRFPDRTPHDNGQYGAAVHYLANWLHDTDLGLYAMNYHSRLPVFSTTSGKLAAPPSVSGSNLFAEYPENIHLYGASFNTSLPGGFALQGEYSFKQGQPLQIDGVEVLLATIGLPSQYNPGFGATLGNKYIQGWQRKNISQVDLGTTKLFGPSEWFGWSQVLLVGEAAVMYVHNMENPSQLRYNGPNSDLPGTASTAALLGVPQQDPSSYATSTSWGYNLMAKATYNNVFNLVTLEPSLRFVHDVQGISPQPVSDFIQGRKIVTTALGARYHEVSGEVGYTNFFGGGTRNLLSDRDFVSATVRYSF